MIVAHTQPFFQSTSGILVLVFVGAIATFLFTIMPVWFRQDRKDRLAAKIKQQDEFTKQNLVLARIVNAIAPENRPGLVQRVEELELNVSTVVNELDNHILVSRDHLIELRKSLQEVKEYLSNDLRQTIRRNNNGD